VGAATFYDWRSKQGGMAASDLRCLRGLEAVNRRLKQMSAELRLDQALLRKVAERTLCAREPSVLVSYAVEKPA
jgi:putative transposase